VIFDDENGNGSQDVGEAGIAGATVTLNGGDTGVSIALVRTTMTNADGVYTFTGVPEGQYTIQVDLPGGQSSVNTPTLTVTVSGDGMVAVPPTPVQVGSSIYLPTLQRG
jgi:hypothetical protein